MRRFARPILIAVLVGMLAIPGRKTLAQPQPPLPPAFPVGANPFLVAINSATHTAYVSNGNDATISVVDVSHCHAGDTSSCSGSAATVSLAQPGGLVIDQATNTVYVTDGADNAVLVLNGATCNATVHTGCSGPFPTTAVGPGPGSGAIDRASNTLYILNGNNEGQGSVSVVDMSHCNALDTSGCSRTWPSVPVGLNTQTLAYDLANRTVYVADCSAGDLAADCSPSGALSMIDALTCNGQVATGCSSPAPTVAVPNGAGWVDVDNQTDTIYVVGFPERRAPVSVIDGASCNARNTSGCSRSQPSVLTGSIPIGLVVDQATGSVFVTSQEDSTVSVVDGTSCNARITRGCGGVAPNVGVGFDPGISGLDPATGTLYVPSQNENNVFVLDVRACAVTHPSGCRHAAPTTTVGNAPQGIAIDHKTGTIYVGDRSDNRLSIINGAICNGNRRSGCKTAWPTVATDPSPQSIAVDEATRTLYTGNNSGTVSVIDIAHCNAADQSRCGQPHGRVTISPTDDRLRSIAVDEAIRTVYVTDGSGNQLAMIDTTTCNGTTRLGCSAPPATVPVGTFPDGLAIDPVTQTVYAANWKSATVSVIDATTCNAHVSSGCGSAHPAIPVGDRPNLMDFNPRTNTLYVPNADSGTVLVIDTTRCNAKVSSGCWGVAATIAVSSPDVAQGAPSPFAVRLDGARNILYITDVVDSDIMEIDGATCNAHVTSGCTAPLALVPVGGWPTDAAIDPALDALYVSQNVDAEASIVPLLHAHAGALGRSTRTTSFVSESSITVWFDSPTPGQGYILFGSGPGCLGLVETATQDQGAGTTSHMVQVQGNELPGTVGDNGIVPGLTYWYETMTVSRSGTEIDNNGGKCYSVTVPPV